MTKINDGGPAFPFWNPGTSLDGQQTGMTLRDWFAGQALAGITSALTEEEIENLANGVKGGKFIAVASYALADAVLAAREEGSDQ